MKKGRQDRIAETLTGLCKIRLANERNEWLVFDYEK